MRRVVGAGRHQTARGVGVATNVQVEPWSTLDKGPGGFAGHPASPGGFEAQVADMRRNFRFLGPSSAHIFLAMVGEPVPESKSRGHFSHRGVAGG